MREIGIFCGTFNPIHWGHLFLAEYARDQYGLEKVMIVTSPAPPHRSHGLLDGELRHEMVTAAVAANPSFEASRIELDRRGPSYTVDTLRAYRQKYGEKVRLNLLIGQDNLPHLKTWHEPEVLLSLARLLVAPRHQDVTRADLEQQLPAGTACDVIQAPRIPVSGSQIRQRLKEGRSVLYMVVPEVYRLLVDRKHYLDAVD